MKSNTKQTEKSKKPPNKKGASLLPALSLNLKREFFDAIVDGTKKVEYRENKEYWRRRLIGRTYKEIHFRNGYATKAPFMCVEFKGLGKVGSDSGSHFAIRLGKILELKNYKR